MKIRAGNKMMPREKLVSQGAAALTDAELLAIFLRVGVAGKSAIVLAADMLHHFGGFNEILSADIKSFSAVKGLGLAKFAQLQASSELVKRAINQGFDAKTAFSEPAVVDRYLLANFKNTAHERFAGLFLNSKNHLLKFEYLFNGGINTAQVYPRTVAQYCLKHNAAAVIFAHNHPSGDVTPSQSDIDLTHRLKETLALIDVKILDHFVVGNKQTFSMAVNQMI